MTTDCGTVRDRNRLYIVRDDETGQLLQLGHNCIELYTGLSPKGLWSLTFPSELSAYEVDDGFSAGRTSDYGIAVLDVLSLAYAHSDRGRAYVSAARRDIDEPTIDRVRTSLFMPLEKLRDSRDNNATYYYYRDMAIEAAQYRANTALMADIMASVSDLNEKSDYGQNMRILVAGERVSGRNVGVLASLVSVYNRLQEKKAIAASTPEFTQGFLAPIGAKIKDLELTVSRVQVHDGRYGTSTWIVAHTKDGHVVVWNASKYIDVEAGEPLSIASATVKNHDNYRGTDQTIITRAKLATT